MLRGIFAGGVWGVIIGGLFLALTSQLAEWRDLRPAVTSEAIPQEVLPEAPIDAAEAAPAVPSVTDAAPPRAEPAPDIAAASVPDAPRPDPGALPSVPETADAAAGVASPDAPGAEDPVAVPDAALPPAAQPQAPAVATAPRQPSVADAPPAALDPQDPPMPVRRPPSIQSETADLTAPDPAPAPVAAPVPEQKTVKVMVPEDSAAPVRELSGAEGLLGQAGPLAAPDLSGQDRALAALAPPPAVPDAPARSSRSGLAPEAGLSDVPQLPGADSVSGASTAPRAPVAAVQPEADAGMSASAAAPEAPPAPVAPPTPEPEPEPDPEPEPAPEPEQETDTDTGTDIATAAPEAPAGMPRVNRLGGADGAADTVRIRRLPSIGDGDSGFQSERGPAPAAVTPRATGRALARNAERFVPPADAALIAVILVHGPDSIIRSLPMPVTFAVDAADPEAPALVEAYRAAGHEVVLIPDLPFGATAQDVEVALSATLARIDGAVALIDADGNGFQGDRQAAGQVVSIAGDKGFGLVTQRRGFNSAHRAALAQDVPTVQIFRALEADMTGQAAIARALDQAGLRARTEGEIVVLGAAIPAQIDAVTGWAEEAGERGMALAPLSAVFRAK